MCFEVFTAVKMGAVCYFGMLVTTHKTVRRHNPEDQVMTLSVGNPKF